MFVILQVIHFRCLERSEKDEFCLQLSKLDSYDEVVKRVANQLGVDDPSKLRLTLHNIYSHRPKAHPITYRGLENLLEMLLHYDQVIHFRSLETPEKDEFCLQLLSTFSPWKGLKRMNFVYNCYPLSLLGKA
ncbi:ubiquitin carboxyl-terminal hydrolase 13-like [Sesamum indicum]|uniref:Ubiquitin carboxyl-terminal hydrolase 13-like n=1 Tax=Sesamum indicum TaxID=4182 RepID=A0A8M8USL7_SESIN|nr:ubiquitin carboxyl-terminal hydrolase 13-like [Sesamum indicum]